TRRSRPALASPPAAMQSRALDHEFRRILYAIAALIVIEPLLFLAVLVVNARAPEYLWLPVTAWIALTIAFLAWIIWDLRRHDVGIVPRPAVRVLGIVVAGITLATVALIVLSAIGESLIWLWLALYLLAVVAIIAWAVRWQAAHLAFECTDCGHVFTAPARTWLLTPNMGTHKWARCPNCGAHW